MMTYGFSLLSIICLTLQLGYCVAFAGVLLPAAVIGSLLYRCAVALAGTVFMSPLAVP